MLRTEAVTGRWIPLGAGVLFVAAILPMTTGQGSAVPLALAIALGVVANLVMLAAVMLVRQVVLRFLP
jgi:hypothetical protein